MRDKRTGKISFEEIEINADRTSLEYKIYVTVKNGRCNVTDYLDSLSKDTVDDIQAIMIRIAENGEKYKSEKIKWQLKKYKYGEIRPLPHRIYFFKYQKNIVFFYSEKKDKWEFTDKHYRQIEKLRKEYYEEFQKFISQN